MLQYFSCYGQIASDSERPDSYGKAPLTETGKEQSRLLGEHLQSLGFAGVILTAPHPPCLETAQIIADKTGGRIIPFGGLCERCDSEDRIQETVKWTEEALKEAFGGTEKLLCPDWIPRERENKEQFHTRIVKAYRFLLEQGYEEEILFLTPFCVCETLVSFFDLPRKENMRLYNCALTSLDPVRWKTQPILFDSSFLPYEKTTRNGKSRAEWDVEYMRSPYGGKIPIPDLSAFTGERILHIGDTESNTYPFYRKLIESLRPDVILHTGDLADEVKLERHPERLGEYRIKAREMIELMRQSGARMILVMGNHDDYQTVSELAPDAEILMPGSELILSGVPCRVGHKVREMVFDRKYCFYGHGMSGETWRYALNLPGEPCRFNSGFGIFLCDLQKDLFVRWPRFYC